MGDYYEDGGDDEYGDGGEYEDQNDYGNAGYYGGGGDYSNDGGYENNEDYGNAGDYGNDGGYENNEEYGNAGDYGNRYDYGNAGEYGNQYDYGNAGDAGEYEEQNDDNGDYAGEDPYGVEEEIDRAEEEDDGEYVGGVEYGDEEEYREQNDDYQDDYQNENRYEEEQEDDGGNKVLHAEVDGFGKNLVDNFDPFSGGGTEKIFDILSNFSNSGVSTNIFSSNILHGLAGTLLKKGAEHFFSIDPTTGQIIGAIAGNEFFRFGGHHNILSDIGKVVLNNLLDGKFKRDVQPYVPNVNFTPLDFNQERQKCLAQRTLFEDPQFPARAESLYYKTPPDQEVTWLRPAQIVDDPMFIVGDHSRFDVKQGALGDCWLLAGIANLTLRDELFYRVVPPDQSFIENYAGIFHFQFWRYGKWVDVVIDDRLPTVNGRLYYLHSQENNEFWSALLEKAYAKLYGCYENLDGGLTSEALEDFTGGLTEMVEIKDMQNRQEYVETMGKSLQAGSLLGCCILGVEGREARKDNGLVCGHAYSITAITNFNNRYGGTIPLLRIRNPWGNDVEWKGDYSDKSPLWQDIDPQQKQNMGVHAAKDGEFWMPVNDFFDNFTDVEICTLSADVMNEISEMTGLNVVNANNPPWEEVNFDGAWSNRQNTAGGKSNADGNVQYLVTVTPKENVTEQPTLIVSLVQKYVRERTPQGAEYCQAGIAVYRTYGDRLTQDGAYSSNAVAKSAHYFNIREATLRVKVQPGTYAILPTTLKKGEEGEYLLRIFSNCTINTRVAGPGY